MNITPASTCAGVACDMHGRCQRYARVEGSAEPIAIMGFPPREGCEHFVPVANEPPKEKPLELTAAPRQPLEGSLPPTPSELAEALRAMRRSAAACFSTPDGRRIYTVHSSVPELGALSDSADLIEQQARELAEMAQERADLLARVIELSDVQPASKATSTLRGMLARPGQEPVPVEQMSIGAAQPAGVPPGFGKIPAGKFGFGDSVYKIKGADWYGRICGWYSTSLTPEGYAVESAAHPGSVQIYPASALEPAESSTPPVEQRTDGSAS